MLSTLDSLVALLGMQNASKNNVTALEECLRGADAAVKNYCMRDFESQAYTEYYDGNGKRDLPVRQRPVTAVASVNEDYAGYYGDAPNAFAATTLLTAGVDYVLLRDGKAGASESGILRKIADTAGNWYPVSYSRLGTLSQGRYWPQWQQYPGSVKVVYTAGYVTTAGANFNVPLDLREAVNELAAYTFRTRKYGGQQIQNEQLGQYMYELLPQQETPEAPAIIGTIRQKLARFKDIPC